MEYLRNYGIENEEDFCNFFQFSKTKIKIIAEIMDIKKFCINSVESIINYLNFEIKEGKNKENFNFDYLCIIQKVFYEKLVFLDKKYKDVLKYFLECLEILNLNKNHEIFSYNFDTNKFSITYDIILLDHIDDFLYFERQINKINSLTYVLRNN